MRKTGACVQRLCLLRRLPMHRNNPSHEASALVWPARRGEYGAGDDTSSSRSTSSHPSSRESRAGTPCNHYVSFEGVKARRIHRRGVEIRRHQPAATAHLRQQIAMALALLKLEIGVAHQPQSKQMLENFGHPVARLAQLPIDVAEGSHDELNVLNGLLDAGSDVSAANRI